MSPDGNPWMNQAHGLPGLSRDMLGLPATQPRERAKHVATHMMSPLPGTWLAAFVALAAFVEVPPIPGGARVCFIWTRGWIVIGWGNGGRRGLPWLLLMVFWCCMWRRWSWRPDGEENKMVMAWCWTGNMPSPETMMIHFTDAIWCH